MIHSATRTVFAGALGLTLSVAACADNGDPEAVAALERAVPTLPEGALYVSGAVDGSCRTDCPPPGLSRGWIVDCGDVDTERRAIVGDLEDRGFTSTGGDGYRATIDGIDIEVNVFSYTNPADGPAASEEPFVSDPSLLSGRCSVFVAALATP